MTIFRRKVHLFLLFLLITLNMGVGKNTIKSKVSKITKAKTNTRDENNNKIAAEIRKKSSNEEYETGSIEKSIERYKRSDPESLTSLAFALPLWDNEKQNDFIGKNISPRQGSDCINPLCEYVDSQSKDQQNTKADCDSAADKLNNGQVIWRALSATPEDDPFWASRGRRRDTETLPFWGNRGRRDNSFIGNTGYAQYRRTDDMYWNTKDRSNPFWRNTNPERTLRNNYFWSTISKNKLGSNMEKTGFWKDRGRNSKIGYLFDSSGQDKMEQNSFSVEPNTNLDEKMYAEQPHYIIVERSSRSAEDDDPFVISRGKKMFFQNDWRKVARDRRGALEAIVKSVKTDPYFIARGKKDGQENAVLGSTVHFEDFIKTKELVCSAVELMNEGKRVKKEVIEKDRGGRDVLKKLAEQIQNDPYFVSRGKRNGETDEESLKKFINEMATLCT